MFILYLLFLTLFVLSIMVIRENAWVGGKFEKMFSLKTGSFYKAKQDHSIFVMLMKWPMLLAMIGLIVPSPWIYDFIIGFLLGVAYHAYRWMKAKADVATKEAQSA